MPFVSGWTIERRRRKITRAQVYQIDRDEAYVGIVGFALKPFNIFHSSFRVAVIQLFAPLRALREALLRSNNLPQSSQMRKGRSRVTHFTFPMSFLICGVSNASMAADAKSPAAMPPYNSISCIGLLATKSPDR